MQITWNDKDPIYRQLHNKLVELILENVLKEGDALPSIRDIASEHRINHITVSKAIQLLVDEDLVEKRRGLGMFVKEGAQKKLLKLEKDSFLQEEWPVIRNRIDRLGLSVDELLKKGLSKGDKKS